MNIFIDGVIGITEHLQVGNLITYEHHKIKESALSNVVFLDVQTTFDHIITYI
jgi:hypothetical protein